MKTAINNEIIDQGRFIKDSNIPIWYIAFQRILYGNNTLVSYHG